MRLSLKSYVYSAVYSVDYLINSFWTLKVLNHDLYKEGFVGGSLKYRPLIMEMKLALLELLFKLCLSFFFLLILNFFLLYFAVTFGQDYLWILC